MSSKESLIPLKRSVAAVKQIRQALIPFVKYLSKSKQTKNDRFSVPDPYKIAEAEAACALAIGTLRYMGARLGGQNNGHKKDENLRQELDKMRKTIVMLRGFQNKKGGHTSIISSDGCDGKKKSGDNTLDQSLKIKKSEPENQKNDKDIGKVIDVNASTRMIGKALNTNKRLMKTSQSYSGEEGKKRRQS